MISIPQSTAYLIVFKAYLASDHATEATGKTIAITISKNGGAFGNPNVGALNATEISSGWYKFTLDTTDTNTIGPIAYRGAVATIDDVGSWVSVVSATTGGATNLDAAISTVTTKTNLIPGTQDGKTFAETTLLMASTLLGKASGMATATGVFRALNDTKDRVTATIDVDGNRTAVTLDAT